jgi:predicted transcriptional regulator
MENAVNPRQKAALLTGDGSTPALDALIEKGFFEKRGYDYILTKTGENFIYGLYRTVD